MIRSLYTNIHAYCIGMRSRSTKVNTNMPDYCISMRSMFTKVNTNISSTVKI